MTPMATPQSTVILVSSVLGTAESTEPAKITGRLT
jgi:hypothetical protein